MNRGVRDVAEGGVGGEIVSCASSKNNTDPDEPSIPRLRAGDIVEGNYRGKGWWYYACVIEVRADGTCTLLYEDGDLEERAEPRNISALFDDNIKVTTEHTAWTEHAAWLDFDTNVRARARRLMVRPAAGEVDDRATTPDDDDRGARECRGSPQLSRTLW